MEIVSDCKMVPRSLQDISAMKIANCVNDFRDIEPKLQFEIPASLIRLVERAWIFDLIKDSNVLTQQMTRYIFLQPYQQALDVYNMPGYGAIDYLRKMTDGVVNKLYMSKLHHVDRGWCNVYCGTARANTLSRREEKKRKRRIIFNKFYLCFPNN